ncbi:MAG: nickel-responsive transcriptional regulator NikR [Candidatus Altiarchaeales archaeon ex4484_96]|nr:MAG: nickel-responsive transcriptional regulator NikR [Candidatus Altiarchaeales archaeon ex4484_96]
MDKQHTQRIGVSLPPKLLDKFDNMIGEMGYNNRSEAIRDAIRNYMLKNQLKDEGGDGVGVILITYDHHRRGVTELITDIQHHHISVIESSTHLHLDKNNCMELIIVRGEIREIQKIKNKLSSVAGVKQTELIITSTIR